jgi:hypothetical protein
MVTNYLERVKMKYKEEFVPGTSILTLKTRQQTKSPKIQEQVERSKAARYLARIPGKKVNVVTQQDTNQPGAVPLTYELAVQLSIKAGVRDLRKDDRFTNKWVIVSPELQQVFDFSSRDNARAKNREMQK